MSCDNTEDVHAAHSSSADVVVFPRARSIAEYLVLEQPDGSWLMREWSEPDTVLDLKSISGSLRLGDLYLKARF